MPLQPDRKPVVRKGVEEPRKADTPCMLHNSE